MVLDLNRVLSYRRDYIGGDLLLFGRAGGGRFGSVKGMRAHIADITTEPIGLLLFHSDWTTPVVEFGEELQVPSIRSNGIPVTIVDHEEFGLDTSPYRVLHYAVPMWPNLVRTGLADIPLHEGLEWQAFCLFEEGEFDRFGSPIYPMFEVPANAA